MDIDSLQKVLVITFWLDDVQRTSTVLSDLGLEVRDHILVLLLTRDVSILFLHKALLQLSCVVLGCLVFTKDPLILWLEILEVHFKGSHLSTLKTTHALTIFLDILQNFRSLPRHLIAYSWGWVVNALSYLLHFLDGSPTNILFGCSTALLALCLTLINIVVSSSFLNCFHEFNIYNLYSKFSN